MLSELIGELKRFYFGISFFAFFNNYGDYKLSSINEFNPLDVIKDMVFVLCNLNKQDPSLQMVYLH